MGVLALLFAVVHEGLQVAEQDSVVWLLTDVEEDDHVDVLSLEAVFALGQSALEEGGPSLQLPPKRSIVVLLVVVVGQLGEVHLEGDGGLAEWGACYMWVNLDLAQESGQVVGLSILRVHL